MSTKEETSEEVLSGFTPMVPQQPQSQQQTSSDDTQSGGNSHSSNSDQDRQQEQKEKSEPTKADPPSQNSNNTSNSNKKGSTSCIWASRFRTKLCDAYSKKGECSYGYHCMFAHGPQELRTKEMNFKDSLTTENAIKLFQQKTQRDALNEHVARANAQKAASNKAKNEQRQNRRGAPPPSFDLHKNQLQPVQQPQPQQQQQQPQQLNTAVYLTPVPQSVVPMMPVQQQQQPMLVPMMMVPGQTPMPVMQTPGAGPAPPGMMQMQMMPVQMMPTPPDGGMQPMMQMQPVSQQPPPMMMSVMMAPNQGATQPHDAAGNSAVPGNH